MKRISIPTVLAVLLLASCSRERPETVFRTLDLSFRDLPTRSLLTAPDIETKKTAVTLAAYAGGTLAASGHFLTGLDAMALSLEPNKTYTVYALVNMGDMTASIPRSESELASLTYRIPSYTEGAESLAARGLPMAGKLTWPDQGTTIPVERLLTKVTAHLSCEWEGAAIRSVHVRNLNRVLRPFGEAVMAEDWDQQEFHAGAGTASGTFVFYVPENRQGTIDGIRTSREKSPDANDGVRARSSRLTYLETTVEGTSVYAGTIVYRSYLGQNAVSDFDLRRNARYDWTIRYLPDGLQYDDWKHDNDLIDTQSGLHIADGWDDGGETDLN
ncbi:MAG: DUF4906 domain-containing protein [Bacteroidales bacterium]|nr:DUF4906 domain-containing protein [Bacteroidales bacterium]